MVKCPMVKWRRTPRKFIAVLMKGVKKMDAQNADEEDLRFLENLENEIKNKK